MLLKGRNTDRAKSDYKKKRGGGAGGWRTEGNFGKEGAEIPSQCKFWYHKSGKVSQLLKQKQQNENHKKNSPAEDHSKPEYIS